MPDALTAQSRSRERLYLPTLAELIDRLCIVQLKEIHIGAHRDEYVEEKRLIMHDIDLLRRDRPALGAEDILAVAVLMLANSTIWNNESKAREGGSEQDYLLKFTHSINGVRSAAKNVLAQSGGERKDLKVDCLAADIPAQFGNWRIWA